jgi:hypothetical protein
MAMASSRIRRYTTALAAAASGTTCLLSVNTAFALQGPSGGPSTATPFAQFAMAVLVYGILALVVGTGLIGAMRRR